MLSFFKLLAVAATARFALILYAEWHDKQFELRYTDVDYDVFTQAAEWVVKGESPYQSPGRITSYRYTPLIAYAMVPAVTFASWWGKAVFATSDILCGIVIRDIVRFQGRSSGEQIKCASYWLLNPAVMVISTRGSAEAIISLAVLLALDLVLRDYLVLGALVFGFAVHLKLYPIIYALPFVLYLNRDRIRHGIMGKWGKTLFAIVVSKKSWAFGLISAAVFCSLFVLFHWIYGAGFDHEYFLYHFERTDPKHNFSIYFWPLQLFPDWASVIGRFAFVPQALAVVWSGASLVQYDLPFACMIQTMLFVTFNKVITAQYFVWYLTLLPVAKFGQLTQRKALSLAMKWTASCGNWLFWAWLLEFKKLPVSPIVWLSSVLFFVVNLHLVSQTSKFTRERTKSE